MKGKYGEPWQMYEFRPGTGLGGKSLNTMPVVFASGRKILEAFLGDTPDKAARAVSCVNALDGMNPEKLGEFVDAAKCVQSWARAIERRDTHQGYAINVDALDRFDRALAALENTK